MQKRSKAFTYAELLAFLATIAAIWWLVTPDESRSSMRGYPRRASGEESPSYGTLVIETYPPRARIFLDDFDTNKHSNIDVLHKILTGPHRLRIEKDGYAPAEIEVQVSANKVVRPPLIVLQKARP